MPANGLPIPCDTALPTAAPLFGAGCSTGNAVLVEIDSVGVKGLDTKVTPGVG